MSSSYQTERYQVIREPDGRGVVVDAQNFFVPVFGPASIEACLQMADEMNRDEKIKSRK